MKVAEYLKKAEYEIKKEDEDFVIYRKGGKWQHWLYRFASKDAAERKKKALERGEK
jgi:hypothetical protein